MSARKVRWTRVWIYVVLVLAAVLYLLPLYMTVATSLKAPADIRLDTAWEFPRALHWDSYRTAWQQFSPQLRHSFVLAITATVLSTVMGSMNGYVFSKWPFRGSEIIFPLVLFGMFIPYQRILIPLFQFLRSTGLYGGLPGLILVHVVYGLPIATLIFRKFYAQSPDDLPDAATLDVAGFFRIYGRIVLPLSEPGFVVTVIWQFTQIWNDF